MATCANPPCTATPLVRRLVSGQRKKLHALVEAVSTAEAQGGAAAAGGGSAGSGPASAGWTLSSLSVLRGKEDERARAVEKLSEQGFNSALYGLRRVPSSSAVAGPAASQASAPAAAAGPAPSPASDLKDVIVSRDRTAGDSGWDVSIAEALNLVPLTMALCAGRLLYNHWLELMQLVGLQVVFIASVLALPTVMPILLHHLRLQWCSAVVCDVVGAGMRHASVRRVFVVMLRSVANYLPGPAEEWVKESLDSWEEDTACPFADDLVVLAGSISPADGGAHSVDEFSFRHVQTLSLKRDFPASARTAIREGANPAAAATHRGTLLERSLALPLPSGSPGLSVPSTALAPP